MVAGYRVGRCALNEDSIRPEVLERAVNDGVRGTHQKDPVCVPICRASRLVYTVAVEDAALK